METRPKPTLKDQGEEQEVNVPIVLRAERRARRGEELSCEEIMRIVRKRGSRNRKKVIEVD